MRDDAQPMTTNDLEASLDDGRTATSPRSGRSGVRFLKVPALLVLVTGTCWAVASLLTVWLVPPYLVALGWILFPSPGSIPRPGWGKRDRALPTESLAFDPARDQAGGIDGEGSPSATAGLPPPGADPELAPDSTATTATATAKPKRARSRARKVKPTAEPVDVAPATWVEVGPGKFVRVETPSPTVTATAHGPHLAVEPEPIAAAESKADPTDGSAPPDFAILPDLDREFATDDSLAGPSLRGADDIVATLNEAEAPTEGLTGSLIDPVADHLDARTLPEAPDLIDPTADGIAPQVGVDEEPDPRIDRPTEVHATAFDRELVLDPWDRDAPAPLADPTDAFFPNEPTAIASEESAEIFDPEIEDDGGWRETAFDEPMEAGCGSGIASGDDLEVAEPTLDVSGPHVFAPLTRSRRSRVESIRLTHRRAPRGFRQRLDRLTEASTTARRLVRRVVGRSRQISRTAKPRSPPATF